MSANPMPPPPENFATIVQLIRATPLAERPHLVAALRRFLHGEQSNEPGGVENATAIHMQSMYGAASETPYVQLSWGAEMAQLTCREARAHAAAIIETAANAEGDAAFIRFIRERIGIDDTYKLAEIMTDYRAMRS